jgi:hypothetical protein
MMDLISKKEKIVLIRERDGSNCFICKLPFINEKPTIDHWIPRALNGSEDIANLRLAHKKCNTKKGDVLPNEDGTITYPAKNPPYRKRRNNREKILSKFCYECEDGRKISIGQLCGICGSPPGPPENPRYLKRKSPECDHNIFWCWACSIGIVEKKSAAQNLITG